MIASEDGSAAAPASAAYVSLLLALPAATLVGVVLLLVVGGVFARRVNKRLRVIETNSSSVVQLQAEIPAYHLKDELCIAPPVPGLSRHSSVMIQA